MKLILAIILAVALAAWQASPPLLLPLWTGTGYSWVRLGPSLAVAGGQIDALPQPTKTRTYGVVLTHDVTAGGWMLPAGASNVVVWVNGLRYNLGMDYKLMGSVIVPLYDNMLPIHYVIADFDR